MRPAPVTTIARQCPTCGRCDQDWTAPASRQTTLLEGVKAAQHRSTEDRTRVYREWRRTLGPGLYVNDVDHVEWRMVDGHVVPVALLELTRVNGLAPVPPTYLDRILDRMCDRDPQAKFACEIAARIGVSAFVVVFRWDCGAFWVYNLSARRGWWSLTPEKYRTWIEGLR